MASDNYRSDPERAAQLAVYLALHAQAKGYEPSPAFIGRAVAAMQKAARGAKRQAEYACNYGLDDAGAKRAERMHKRAQDKIAELLAAVTGGVLTCHVGLGGDPRDPRGPCATLHIPGQRGDGWGDGFAVY